MNTEDSEFERIEAEAKRQAAQQELTDSGKRGSIALARSLCYEIAGATSEDDMDGGGYGSVDIAEILSAEVLRLQKALAKLEQQAKPISTNGAMRDARLNAGWGSEQQAEPPPEWPLIKNILAVFGLDAISFVAKWQAAQRPWVGLTDEDWEHIDNKKGTALDTFAQGAVWAANRLKERNT